MAASFLGENDCKSKMFRAVANLGLPPFLAIARDARLVILPALGIGAVAGIGDGERQILPGTAGMDGFYYAAFKKKVS